MSYAKGDQVIFLVAHVPGCEYLAIPEGTTGTIIQVTSTIRIRVHSTDELVGSPSGWSFQESHISACPHRLMPVPEMELDEIERAVEIMESLNAKEAQKDHT